jgi:alkaline phosphatase D
MRNNNRGYVRCTLTPDSWTSEFRIVDSVRQPDSQCSTLATFVVENGNPAAQRVGV